MTKFLNANRSIAGALLNENIAAQVANAADTYLAGSSLGPQTVPNRSHFKWRFVVTKTAAGIAAPAFKLRIGTLGTIADAVRLTLTSPTAQTAAIDTACIEIYAILRTLGADNAAAILSGHLKITHDLATTGFADRGTPQVHAVSAAFNLPAIVNPYIGISVDPGAAGVWTFEQVVAEMKMT